MLTVRVVDDTDDIAHLLAVMLEMEADMKVEVTTDNMDDLLHPDLWEHIDVAVVDLMMPEVSGAAVLRWLVENRPDIRRVVWTAAANLVDDDLRAVADAVLTKPATVKALLEAVTGARE